MWTRYYTPALLLAGFVLGSCDSGTSVSSLWGTQGSWQLQSLGAAAVSNPDRYTLVFDEAGRVNLRADCNVCSGSYETKGNSLTIGVVACTRAFCPPPSLSDDFIRAVASATLFERRGEELLIEYGGGTMSFRVQP